MQIGIAGAETRKVSQLEELPAGRVEQECNKNGAELAAVNGADFVAGNKLFSNASSASSARLAIFGTTPKIFDSISRRLGVRSALG